MDRIADIEWIFARAARVLVEHGEVVGLEFEEGGYVSLPRLVVTTGTFLNGLIHIGEEQLPAGRAGEPPSRDLAESLKSLGFAWGRLKTGTPPRLDRREHRFRRVTFAQGRFIARARAMLPDTVLVHDVDASNARRSIAI